MYLHISYFFGYVLYNMSWLTKRFALFVYKPIISILSARKTTGDFLNTPLQPSNRDCFSNLFLDKKIHSVYHSKYGIVSNRSYLVDMMANKFLGNLFPYSTYKFVDERDYITTMASVGFTDFNKSDASVSPVDQLMQLFEKYVGYLMFEPSDNDTFVLSTKHLSKYEIRPGYSTLNTLVCLNKDLSFNYCEVGEKRYLSDSPGIEFAVRECMTAITTLFTVEKHLFNVHMLVNDKINTLVEVNLTQSHPIRRLLGMYANKPYIQQEIGTLSLLAPKGFGSFFNLTQKGVLDYLTDYSASHNIRKELYVADQLNLFSNENMNGDMKLWWGCISKFVSEFIKLNSAMMADTETKLFLDQIKQEYPGVGGAETDDLKILSDICCMALFSNIIHETYSNSSLGMILCNPFVVSSTWKSNDSSNLSDKINNLSEQLMSNIILVATKPESIPMGSELWETKFANNDDERKVFRDFRTSIGELQISETSILHPKNISSSISA